MISKFYPQSEQQKIIHRYLLVNSDISKKEFFAHVDKLYNEHKYLTFAAPRIGPDRSLDQNALAHVWLTEYAAHLLNKGKKQVTAGELEGMKRTAKKEFYRETRHPWMVYDVVSPKTAECKKDFTSSAGWKRGEMYEFLCWLQAMAAHDGLVLESKGEFAKLQREKNGYESHGQ